MSGDKQTTDPMQETKSSTAQRGGVGLPLPPLQRDPAVSHPPKGK